MENMVRKYVSRYVIPFYFDYENDGYNCITSSMKENKYTADIINQLQMPTDGKWIENGFWQDNSKQAEMDIYSYLPNLLKEYSEDNKKFGTNLGKSFIYDSNGNIFKLKYQTNKYGNKNIDFSCNKIGLLIFKNGVGFIWYDIEFSPQVSIAEYLAFQHDFKELARTHDDKFTKRIGRNERKDFCLGIWLAQFFSTKELGIQFWAERVHIGLDNKVEMRIPDKALLFQYVFLTETNKFENSDMAFRIANGYDLKYNAPEDININTYQPFGNTCFYTSKSGTAYVVSDKNSNYDFFRNGFSEKFTRDYFFMYILLLYQNYSCAHYSRLLTKLPAEINVISMRNLESLESLNSQIDLFLVKSIFESVSNVQHQNGFYQYSKTRLCIENDIKSITVGLDSLRGMVKENYSKIEAEKEKEKVRIQREREEAEEEKEKQKLKLQSKKERKLNLVLSGFGILTIISILLDSLNLINWFTKDGNSLHAGHITILVFIGVITIMTIGVILKSWFTKKEKEE